jgi:hypothetical protein
LPPRQPMSLEIAIGRGLALCLHPTAAWRIVSTRGRAILVGAYVGAGYVVVLAALLFVL